MCVHTCVNMCVCSSFHELLKSDHLHLESKNVESRAEITDLKGKLSSQITSNELLKVKVPFTHLSNLKLLQQQQQYNL